MIQAYSPTKKIISCFDQKSYIETDDPFPVPKIPDNRIPTPCYMRNTNQ